MTKKIQIGLGLLNLVSGLFSLIVVTIFAFIYADLWAIVLMVFLTILNLLFMAYHFSGVLEVRLIETKRKGDKE